MNSRECNQYEGVIFYAHMDIGQARQSGGLGGKKSAAKFADRKLFGTLLVRQLRMGDL